MPLSQALRKLIECNHKPITGSHYTRGSPPVEGIHSIDFAELDDHINILSWDELELEPIASDEINEIGRVTLGHWMSTPFKLILEAASVQTTIVKPLTLPHYNAHAPFILIPDVEEYVIRGGRVVRQHPPITARPLEGISSHEEVRREDDKILRHTHRDPLIQALSHIRVETTTTPNGLIHMVTAGRATCIVFSDDDLSPDSPNHTRPFLICPFGQWLGLERCPLATAIALGYAPSDFGPSTQTVQAYDSTRREVMETLEIELLIAGTIPFSLHQKVKFIHDGQVITVQSAGDMFISSKPVFQIIFLIEFTFDEEAELQSLVHQLQLSDGAPDTSASALVHGTFFEIEDIVDGAVPHDEYIDEMLVMSMSQIDGAVRLELVSPFNLFGVSIIEVAKEVDTPPVPEFSEDIIVVDDLFDGRVSLHDSDDDSSSASDSNSIDLRVSPAIGDVEIVGFVVEYPEWLANVVPVPKKDGKVKVCVDFRDLNKASPKDDFPFLHIDMLILMAPKNIEKTSFITEWGTYCYRVMPFGLKNAEATYQRVATTLFHDMMHRDVEVYVDDMIVKSRDRVDHLAALERFFERIRQFRLRLNPKKYTFGVTFGKLLGYMVKERSIKADPDKIRTILDMLRGPREISEASWHLLLLPILVPPTPGHPLLLYLSVSDIALGCMLAQFDDLGKERAIYYLSKRMLDYETRYVMIEHYRLALVWATWRLRHYMIEWLVLLTEFDIHYVTQKSIRGSIVADHLASLPVSDGRAIDMISQMRMLLL
ncbi:hypothetical protein AAG906_040546 [Vitis piasezkii]